MQVDGNRFRRRRFAGFLALLDTIDIHDRPLRVLDIGGTVSYWESMRSLWGHRNLDITIVNLGEPAREERGYHLRSGDACSMDDADGSFDVVHSNSVIEHVGYWPEIKRMACEVRRLAPRYYLQTPNFWFPFEPHYRTAFIHWLPEQVRAGMVMRRRRGFHHAPDMDAAMLDVRSINLLTMHQMALLFPDARLVRERFLLFTKSLIAIR
ncbi:methyltransferase domain-containing protein [Xylophilus sp. Kf1]|nr:methyltransferase domain-containing protein [Xylophilus sp. Kf1]